LNMLANSGLISTTKVSWTSSREIEIGLVKFNWIMILSKSYLVAFQEKSILLLSKKVFFKAVVASFKINLNACFIDIC
jgi:hypothetical protein